MQDLLEGLPLPDGLDPDAVTAAQAVVRDYCDWHIAPVVTETVKRPVAGGGVVLLPTLRLIDVVSVNGASTGFDWLPNGRLHITGIPHHGTVSVEFSHGYETCPPSVAAAVFQLAARGLIPKPQQRTDTTGPYAASWYEQANPLDGVWAYRRLVVA